MTLSMQALQQPSTFAERVYAACREIPLGKVTTYGNLAKHLRTSARAVGRALRGNPYAPQVPCHRVVHSDGRLGGFMGQVEGAAIVCKIERLRAEGVVVHAGVVENLEEILHRF